MKVHNYMVNFCMLTKCRLRNYFLHLSISKLCREAGSAVEVAHYVSKPNPSQHLRATVAHGSPPALRQFSTSTVSVTSTLTHGEPQVLDVVDNKWTSDRVHLFTFLLKFH